MIPARRSSALLLVVAMLMAVLAVPSLGAGRASAAGCGTGTNLALNKTATASSVEGAGYAASAAVDGNTGTRWASQWSDPQWIQVDLGSTQSICQVVLNWETASGKAYQIQTSTDAGTWTTIYSTTTGPGGTETLNVSGSGRYIRMYGTARSTGYGYSLWEFGVYGGSSSGGGNPPPTWNLQWQDTFTGGAGTAPSSANWIEDTGHNSPGGPADWGTGEVESASSSTANVSEDGNGHLNITALEDGAGNWTSGRIETQRSDFAAPAGGMLEVTASIKQPNVANPAGYWPAFWALGSGSRTGSGHLGRPSARPTSWRTSTVTRPRPPVCTAAWHRTVRATSPAAVAVVCEPAPAA